MKVTLSIIGTFVGCCTNVIFMEHALRLDSSFGIIVAFTQFAFIALIGFIFTSKCGRERPKIRYKNYVYLVLMFFTAHVCNNYAFAFNVPVPLHMIIRSGSLIANMLLGVLILKKRYTFSKYLSVCIITIGIFICMVVSGMNVKKTSKSNPANNNSAVISMFFWWLCGIALLILALITSAGMGIYQEVLFKTYGKHPNEALYVTHMLPLPGFLLLSYNIVKNVEIANASESVMIPIVDVSLPILWIHLIAIVSTQYLCINSVFVLTTECTSLTVTLIVTLRKFASLIFSILYFNNTFTGYHWFGTFLVFFGTMMFTEAVPASVPFLCTPRTPLVNTREIKCPLNHSLRKHEKLNKSTTLTQRVYIPSNRL